jgi:aminocarboxymuconate-semialdehyde decarboxylase
MTIDRRELLVGAGALGVAAAVGGTAGAQAPSAPETTAPSRVKVVDVHTHMYSPGWVKAVEAAADPNFRIGENRALIYRGGSIGRMTPPMLDWDLRIKDMDAAKVDVGLISLTAPNVYWGTRAQSVAAARSINDDFAAAEMKYDGRIRWFASLPFQYEQEALAELRRAKDNGAIGVCTLTNILGTPLTAPQFRQVWRECEAMQMPVFIHPTTPFTDGMGLADFGLGNTIGFTSETSLCFARLILEGVLDELPNLQLIACHGGGAFPFLAARFDIMWERTTSARKNAAPPSSYLRRLWYDSIVYDQQTLEFLVERVGSDRVLYGSDYPFTIGDMKGILGRVDALPGAQRDAVRSGNAQRLFDL